ncbi:hypothetical protein [Nocardia crassostreae]|uniref:hypothetical protein n=1 Tax=Nocardia crassostreae TaxID=53428 RepID=UPI000B2E0282|nr:hypothetical protein [Nocardia crassostreae]
MVWRTQLVAFPGGVLETRCYEEESGDDQREGDDMRYRPTALGYLRADVSGIGQLWDESRIRGLAEKFGYDFAGVVVYDPATGRPPVARLKAQVNRLDAEAVIVPGPEHFEGGRVPESLVRQVDVITVSPQETHARRTAVGE